MELSFIDEHATGAVAAIVYDETLEVDALLAEALVELRGSGVRVAGLLQKFGERLPSGKRSMWVENVTTGTLIRIDQPRGPGASACTLDADALARQGCVLRRAIALAPDLILVNRFGRAEAEGRGLRPEIAEAICAGVPLLIAVRYTLLSDWERFLGEPANILLPSPAAVVCWARDQVPAVRQASVYGS